MLVRLFHMQWNKKKFRNTAISNGIGQFVTTCCLLFNQEIVPSLNVACTLGYSQTTHSAMSPRNCSPKHFHLISQYFTAAVNGFLPNIQFLQDLRCSQRCCWRFQSSQMWHCVIGWVVPLFWRWECLNLTTGGTTVLQNITVTCLTTLSYLRRLEYLAKTFIGHSP